MAVYYSWEGTIHNILLLLAHYRVVSG